MFLFTNLSDIFLQKHFQVTAAKPLKQFYHSLILGKKAKIVLWSHSELVRLGLLIWFSTFTLEAY